MIKNSSSRLRDLMYLAMVMRLHNLGFVFLTTPDEQIWETFNFLPLFLLWYERILCSVP